MAKVTFYATRFCPYCVMARLLFKRKGADVEEIDVSISPGLRAEMRKKAGGRDTVPQIWIGEKHVGGCDELITLDRAGELDALLAG